MMDTKNMKNYFQSIKSNVSYDGFLWIIYVLMFLWAFYNSNIFLGYSNVNKMKEMIFHFSSLIYYMFFWFTFIKDISIRPFHLLIIIEMFVLFSTFIISSRIQINEELLSVLIFPMSFLSLPLCSLFFCRSIKPLVAVTIYLAILFVSFLIKGYKIHKSNSIRDKI